MRPSFSTASVRIERRLLFLAALFLVIYSTALSLAPAVRARAWVDNLPWTHWLALLAWVVVFALAHWQSARQLPGRDPYFLPLAAILTGWGLLTIARLFPDFGYKQMAWMVIALGLTTLGLMLPHNLGFLRRYKYLWLSSGLLLTGLTLIFGTNPLGYGPRMWLSFLGIYLQPSEPLKLLLIIYLAAYLADRHVLPVQAPGKSANPQLLPLLAPTLMMTGIALLLLVVQRDLGTATIFLVIYSAMVYIASGRKRILLFAALSLALAVVVGYRLFDVVQIRLEAWLNPWLDPSGHSYQIVQSILAMANGGLLGRGPGLGSPGLVPIPHSDFIFSSITEEIGLAGASGLIIILALFAERGVVTALRAGDAFRRYLATGLVVYIAAQSLLIIGGNIRMLPLTGVTLPFVSYGGSSLLTAYLSLGLLLIISDRTGDRTTSPLSSPAPKLHLQLGALLLAGFGTAALITGWWAIVRGPDLLTRTDNPRRTISDRYVRRGSILDRNNQVINYTQGTTGEYSRLTRYPDLGPVVGYTDPVYGQAGLEASLDDWLRGMQGNPDISIWWSHLLYGQPPPGLDVRTTLDLDLQKLADEALGDHTGSAVILNAQDGQILALASHPTFNSNNLAEKFESLVSQSVPALVNRTTQGLYPSGGVLGAMLLALGVERENISLPAQEPDQDSPDLSCALDTSPESLAEAIGQGCQSQALELASTIGGQALVEYMDSLGLFSAPQTELPADQTDLPTDATPEQLVLDEAPRFSPLQIALAAAPLSSGGNIPAPRIILAVYDPQKGWVELPANGTSNQVLAPGSAAAAANALAGSDGESWQMIARAGSSEAPFTWYITGTLPDLSGTPKIVVVNLEENNPLQAMDIGKRLLQAARNR